MTKQDLLQPKSRTTEVNALALTLVTEVTGANGQHVMLLGGGAGLPATALGVGEAVGTH